MRMNVLLPGLVVLSMLLFSSPAFPAEALGDLTGSWLLFVDDHAVAHKENVSRTYHPFTKHAENPLLVADQPWEGTTAYLYGTVLPDEAGRGYRMWYHSWAHRAYRMLYATSKDGLHWEKPALGLVDYDGTKQNNILFRRTHENHSPQVMHTPWEQDPQQRYKFIYFEYGRTPPRFTTTGYYGMRSADGIYWEDVQEDPVLLDHPGDVGNFVWDPHQNRYIGWPKKFSEVRGYRRRCVGYSETTDFTHWPATQLVLSPDEYDDRWVTEESAEGAHTDFYGLCGFAYESMYLGFLWIFPITDGKNDGPVFVELVTSHDGVHWARQEQPRTPILPLGPDGAWDDGMLFTPNHPLVEDGQIKLYYGGFDATHGSGGGTAGIGLATLRKDGFASLDADAEQGVITTKPLLHTAGPLRINYRAREGWLKVEILDQDGAVIPGYGRDACRPLTGDAMEEVVSWGSKTVLPKTDEPLQIRFLYSNASLYAFKAGDQVKIVRTEQN